MCDDDKSSFTDCDPTKIIDDYFGGMTDHEVYAIFDEEHTENMTKWNSKESLQTALLLIIPFGILVVLSVFSNALVCYAILKNKCMYTVTNIFLINLAISDLLLVVWNVPFNILRHLMHEWSLGDIMCSSINYTLIVAAYVSTFTLTAIAIDRHRVLLYPLYPRITKRKGILIIFFIWALSLLLALPFGMYNKVKITDWIVEKVVRCRSDFPEPSEEFEQYLTIVTIVFQYFLPLIITSIAYGRIIRKLWLRTNLGALTALQRRMQLKAKRKSIKLLMAVVLVFAVCWMPLNLYHILTDIHPDTRSFKYNSITFFVCHWVAISSTCINPFLYCWMNPAFRKDTFSKLKFGHLLCYPEKGGQRLNEKSNRKNSRRNTLSTKSFFSRSNGTSTMSSTKCDGTKYAYKFDFVHKKYTQD